MTSSNIVSNHPLLQGNHNPPLPYHSKRVWKRSPKKGTSNRCVSWIVFGANKKEMLRALRERRGGGEGGCDLEGELRFLLGRPTNHSPQATSYTPTPNNPLSLRTQTGTSSTFRLAFTRALVKAPRGFELHGKGQMWEYFSWPSNRWMPATSAELDYRNYVWKFDLSDLSELRADILAIYGGWQDFHTFFVVWTPVKDAFLTEFMQMIDQKFHTIPCSFWIHFSSSNLVLFSAFSFAFCFFYFYWAEDFLSNCRYASLYCSAAGCALFDWWIDYRIPRASYEPHLVQIYVQIHSDISGMFSYIEIYQIH